MVVTYTPLQSFIHQSSNWVPFFFFKNYRLVLYMYQWFLFFWDEFFPTWWVTKTIQCNPSYKGFFCEKKGSKLPDLEELIYNFLSAISSRWPIYIAGVLLKNLLSSLNFSQIWLMPLVDDCQCGYITKLKQKKKKTKGCVTLWPCHLH